MVNLLQFGFFAPFGDGLALLASVGYASLTHGYVRLAPVGRLKFGRFSLIRL